MVKRRSFFYHLPDWLPLKHVFQGSKRTWLIQIEACSQSGLDMGGLAESLAAEIRDRTSTCSNISDSLEHKNRVFNGCKNNVNCKGKRRGIKRFPYLKSVLQVFPATVHLSKRKKRQKVNKSHFLDPTVKLLEKGRLRRNEGGAAKERETFAHRTEDEQMEEWKSSAVLENPSETPSETISVSGIIKKYFSDYEEVTLSFDFMSRGRQSQSIDQLTTGTYDNCSEAKKGEMSPFTPKTPPRILPFPLATDLSSVTSRSKFKRTDVGKRLVVASNKLGISASLQKSAIGLGGFGHKKLLMLRSPSLVRNMVFDISDNDD